MSLVVATLQSLEPGVPHRKYLKIKYAFKLLIQFNRFLSVQVCVKSCPSDTFDALIISNELGEQLTKKKLVCKDYVRVDELTVDELIDQDVCARYYMESNPSKFILSIV